jgi:N utilization substance protein A
VKTLDDLADLASDELIEILGPDSMDEDTANAIIMAARQHWFEGEGPEGEGPEGEPQDEAPEAAGEAVNGDGEKA